MPRSSRQPDPFVQAPPTQSNPPTGGPLSASPSLPRLGVIVASTRPARFADRIVEWLILEIQHHRGDEVEVIDLRDFEIPVAWQEPAGGMYPSAAVQEFARRVDAMDAFIIITPEYNHGYPASLKIALDALQHEWEAKPVAFVSYGGVSGGLRAVEQLRLIVAELHMVDIREGVSFHRAAREFGHDGVPKEGSRYRRNAQRMLDQLDWWATALRDARATMPYR